jgi:hypothetical protein
MTQARVVQSEAGSLPQVKSMEPLSQSEDLATDDPMAIRDAAGRLYAAQTTRGNRPHRPSADQTLNRSRSEPRAVREKLDRTQTVVRGWRLVRGHELIRVGMLGELLEVVADLGRRPDRGVLHHLLDVVTGR